MPLVNWVHNSGMPRSYDSVASSLELQAKRKILELFQGKTRFLEPGEMDFHTTTVNNSMDACRSINETTISIVELSSTPQGSPRSPAHYSDDSEVDVDIAPRNEFDLEPRDTLNFYLSTETDFNQFDISKSHGEYLKDI